MLIDDGVQSRQHRLNILSSKFLIIGVACGITENGMAICVSVFGSRIQPLPENKYPEAQRVMQSTTVKTKNWPGFRVLDYFLRSARKSAS